MVIRFQLNDSEREVEVDGQAPLLYVLRNDLEDSGPRFGCGTGQCGACNVLLDGRPVRSCVLPVSQVDGRQVVTLQGLGTPKVPHPLQQAFLDEQALQCGYCGSGILMSAAALLARNSNPTEDDVREALKNNLCRCGAQGRIIKAVLRAAEGEG